VDRPGLLPGQVETLHQPRHPALAVADAEAALGEGAQVPDAPGDAAVALQPRTPEDQGLERGLAALVQGAGAAGPGPVAQARDALGVVAVHPVPERLACHPGELGRPLARQAVERVGQRQQPGAHPAVVFAAGEPAQLGRVTVGADRQGRGHGSSSRYGCRRNRSAAPSIRHHFSRPV